MTEPGRDGHGRRMEGSYAGGSISRPEFTRRIAEALDARVAESGKSRYGFMIDAGLTRTQASRVFNYLSGHCVPSVQTLIGMVRTLRLDPKILVPELVGEGDPGANEGEEN